MPTLPQYGFRGATEYINHGLGSLAGVVEAARAAGEAKAERQQQWQQQQEQKAQRDAALRQLLADAGIPTPSWQYCGAANHFVHKGAMPNIKKNACIAVLLQYV